VKNVVLTFAPNLHKSPLLPDGNEFPGMAESDGSLTIEIDHDAPLRRACPDLLMHCIDGLGGAEARGSLAEA